MSDRAGISRRLALCRTLCQLDRDILILESGTTHLSEVEEEHFMKSLKSHLRPTQIAIVTSSRLSTGRFADLVVRFCNNSQPVITHKPNVKTFS